MRRKSANIYLRGSTYWGRVKISGREYRRSLLTDDRKEASERFKSWRQKLERNEISGEETPTFREAVVRWGKEVLPSSVKPAVARRYLTSIAVLDDALGPLKVAEITSKKIAGFISARSGTVTNATIRRDLTALSRLLASCIAWGWISDNPARNFDRSIIRERRDPIRPPGPEDVRLVLEACPPGMASILRLLDQTGMRQNEAVTLEAGHIDQARRQILLTQTKTSRPRSIAWKTPAGDAGPVLAAGQARGALFRNRDGNAYRNIATNFGEVMRRVARECDQAGLPFRRFRIHDLRHGYAIRWLKAGGDIYRLSRHLGHTSVKTTEGYLRYLTAEELDQVRAAGVPTEGTPAIPAPDEGGK